MTFVFGFVTWINSILIPHFKIACELTHFQSYLVAFAFYTSYLVMSMPASVLLKKVGFKRDMMVGFFIMSAGAMLFVPAAYLLIMGLCGNAIMPLVYGYFADQFSLRQDYWVLLPCYLYLLFYAVYGHKLTRWQ